MERSRPVVVEAPGPKAPEAEAAAGADEGDGKERRDTTFAVAELAEKAKGEWKGEGEGKLEEQDEDEGGDVDTRSNAPSWRTDDSHKFSHCVADALKLERLARKPWLIDWRNTITEKGNHMMTIDDDDDNLTVFHLFKMPFFSESNVPASDV
jgi:hypothetical protein